jgi:hypothetical protein
MKLKEELILEMEMFSSKAVTLSYLKNDKN